MESFSEFKQYFNKNFWRAFRGKGIIMDVPLNESGKNRLIETLYREISERSYFPSLPKFLISSEKLNGIPRFSPVFEIRDYCVYYYCIKKFEQKIAYNRTPHTFGGWTLGGLIRKSEEDEVRQVGRNLNGGSHEIYIGTYAFNPFAWSKAYGDLNAKLYLFSQNNEFSHVLMMDIANFYDNVRLDLLEQKIRGVAQKSDLDALNLLFTFLNYWNRGRNGYNKQAVGLPQDAMGDFSRILANFYLQDYDDYMYSLCKELGCTYVRYADDQFIFLKARDLADTIRYKATKNLNLLNLSINQMKVTIPSTDELIEHRSFRTFNILATDGDKKNKGKVEYFADQYISLLDTNGLSKLKDRGTPLLNRLLFCPALSSIDFTKKTKIMGCYLDESYLRNADSGKLLRIYELLEEQEKPKFISKLVEMSNKVIFNFFHYQVLDFLKKIGADTNQIKQRLAVLEKF